MLCARSAYRVQEVALNTEYTFFFIHDLYSGNVYDLIRPEDTMTDVDKTTFIENVLYTVLVPGRKVTFALGKLLRFQIQ